MSRILSSTFTLKSSIIYELAVVTEFMDVNHFCFLRIVYLIVYLRNET